MMPNTSTEPRTDNASDEPAVAAAVKRDRAERRLSGLGAGFLFLSAVAVLAATGCGKKGVDGELVTLREAGRSVEGFADTDAAPLGAKRCQTGSLDKVPALLCEYKSAEAAASGQAAAENWVGQSNTGLVLRRETMLLALADRSRVDPHGKAIAGLAKVFRRAAKR